MQKPKNLGLFQKPRSVVGYRGITTNNQFHLRSKPSTDNSILAVLSQASQAKSRDSRGYCSVTAVPITMQRYTINRGLEQLYASFLHVRPVMQRSVIVFLAQNTPWPLWWLTSVLQVDKIHRWRFGVLQRVRFISFCSPNGMFIAPMETKFYAVNDKVH